MVKMVQMKMWFYTHSSSILNNSISLSNEINLWFFNFPNTKNYQTNTKKSFDQKKKEQDDGKWKLKEKEEETNFLALFQFENHNHFTKFYRKTAKKFSLENSIQFLLQNNIITVFLLFSFMEIWEWKLKITA